MIAAILIALSAVVCGPPLLPLAACTCALTKQAGEPEIPWWQRDAVFVATALEVDDFGVAGQRVRFVAEASWRGQIRDTVTLQVDKNAPCAYYRAGGRYLVVADRGNVRESSLRTDQCDMDLSLSHPVARARMLELGRPQSRSPESRSALLNAVQVGNTAAPAQDSVYMSILGGFELSDVQTIRVSDQVWSGGEHPVFRLPHGNYEVLVEWVGGKTSQTHVAVRCEQRFGEQICAAYRFLYGVREPLP